MNAFARFDEVIIAGYFLNGLSNLDVKFANLAPPIWTGRLVTPLFYSIFPKEILQG